MKRKKLTQLINKFINKEISLEKLVDEIINLFETKIRSHSQNKLYWLYLTCIAVETGNDKDELHEFFKQKLLGKKYDILIFGNGINEGYYKIGTTTKLTTEQFKQYLDKIQIFAATELNITLPNPEDIKFKEFEKHYSEYL